MYANGLPDDDLGKAAKAGSLDEDAVVKLNDFSTKNEDAMARMRSLTNRSQSSADTVEHIVSNPLRAASRRGRSNVQVEQVWRRTVRCVTYEPEIFTTWNRRCEQ
jgi:hypothetical protein